MPYPFEALTPETPLALYLEVYGLAFDDADATRYTVAYEVASDAGPSSPLGRLLRGGGEARTEVSTSYTGASRTARERIGLDLSRWRDAGPIVVTVRVTDEVTGAEAERSVPFRMIEG